MKDYRTPHEFAAELVSTMKVKFATDEEEKAVLNAVANVVAAYVKDVVDGLAANLEIQGMSMITQGSTIQGSAAALRAFDPFQGKK